MKCVKLFLDIAEELITTVPKILQLPWVPELK